MDPVVNKMFTLQNSNWSGHTNSYFCVLCVGELHVAELVSGV